MESASASTRRVLDEFYRVAFHKKLHAFIEDLQNDLDLWIKTYNEERPIKGADALANAVVTLP